MFYDRLEYLCTCANISPTKLAILLDIAPSAVTKWKNGTLPNSDRLLSIANYFNVSCDYLLEREKTDPEFSEEEIQLIKNFRKADTRGKENIKNCAKYEGDKIDHMF